LYDIRNKFVINLKYALSKEKGRHAAPEGRTDRPGTSKATSLGKGWGFDAGLEPSSWILAGFRGLPWISMDFHGLPWISMDFHGFSMDFHAFSWIFMDFHGFSWIFMNFHEFS
jgi:hypothetical protein